MAGLIDTSSITKILTKTATENLVTQYFRVEDFGFFKLSSSEKYEQTWYPTPSDIVPAGWFAIDIHNDAYGDFNGDGLVDIVVQPMLNPHVVPHQTPITPIFLIQDGKGGFKDPSLIVDASNFPEKHFLYRLGVADFNKDGYADVSLAAMGSVNRNATGDQSVMQSPEVVFGGLGNKFNWIDSYSNFSVQRLSELVKGYTYGHSMAIGDFNGDHYPDWFSAWYVFYNNQSSGFKASVMLPNSQASIESNSYSTPYSDQWFWPNVNSAASADFNEDGYDDLIYSTMPTSDPSINGGDLNLVRGSSSGLMDGANVIALPRTNDIPGNVGTNFMVAADLNGDGHEDLVLIEHYWVTDSGDSTNYYSKAKLRTFLGDGRGNLVEKVGMINDPYAGHRSGEGNIHVLDVNGDGWLDIVLDGYEVNTTDRWDSGGSVKDSSTIFLNNKGNFIYVEPNKLAYVQPYQFSGEESVKPYYSTGVSKLIPVDIGSDGMVDFVGFIQTPLHQWPQVEQQYTYAYISRAISPLGRDYKDEVLLGTANKDKIYGYDGNDQIEGAPGNDSIDGGEGLDTATYSGSYGSYTLTHQLNGSFLVTDSVSGRDGTDTLTNVERLQFSDAKVALDLDGHAGQVAKILGAVFGKSALSNQTYVGIGLNLLDSGASDLDLAKTLLKVANLNTNDEIVSTLLRNVFGTAASSADKTYLLDLLNQGTSPSKLVLMQANTPANLSNINLDGLALTGIQYTDYENHIPTGSVSITGKVTQGQILTVSNTLADDDGLGIISYQWQADGSNISGATGNNFLLGQAQVGKAIGVIASYTDNYGTAEKVSASTSAKVANINDAPTGAVTFSGSGLQGETLAATNSIADLDGLGSITYQWLRSGVAINGANAKTYVVSAQDAGESLSVRASYIDGGNTTETVTSKESVLVLPKSSMTATIVKGVISGTSDNDVFDTTLNTTAKYQGGKGDDSYIVNASGIVITESANQGNDTVFAGALFTLPLNVENLKLFGLSDIVATGNKSNNLIVGNSANNLISGLEGNDTLTGGAGKDTFVFSTALNAKTNVDTITDFNPGEDLIGLKASIFKKLGVGVEASELWLKNQGSFQTANQYLIYDSNSGTLSYDADGNGKGVAIPVAIIGTNLSLVAGDFVVLQ